MQVTTRLVDDRLFTGGRPQHIPRLVVRHLAMVAAIGIAGPKVQATVGAIRGVVDRVTNPHRLVVGPLPIGDLLRTILFEVIDPNVLRTTTLVTLPRAELTIDRRVDVLLAVGREHARPRFGDHHRAFHAAVGGDQERAPHAHTPRQAVAAEQDVLSVRRPTEDAVVESTTRRHRTDVVVPGQLLWGPALNTDDVDLTVAAVLRREGDALPVGRELGEQLHPMMGGQPSRVAAVGRCQPKVAGIDERNLIAMDIGEAE